MHNKIRVLIVDDHEIIRTGVRYMLDSVNDILVTGEAASTKAALSLLREHTFDVALVDITMPGKSGLELLKQLRAEHLKMAVLIFSMYSEDAYAMRALKMGAAGYLDKMCSHAALITAVRKVAAGGKHVTRSLAEKLVHQISSGSAALHEALSDRELEILKCLSTGSSLVKIASSLNLSASTVTTYRARIMQKTGLKSNVELARYAAENGLL